VVRLAALRPYQREHVQTCRLDVRTLDRQQPWMYSWGGGGEGAFGKGSLVINSFSGAVILSHFMVGFP
jgi:hypothetical protein